MCVYGFFFEEIHWKHKLIKKKKILVKFEVLLLKYILYLQWL